MSTHDDERNLKRREIRERQDEMISAGVDDELGREDRTRLDELLADGSELAARSGSFQRVDEALRSLAEEPIADERLAAMVSSLRTRLGIDRPENRGTSEHEATSRIGMRKWRRGGWPAALATAAALTLYLVLSGPERVTEEPLPQAEVAISEGSRIDAALEADLVEEAVVLALGYGEEISDFGAISNDDLDVIERLDLLDFLTTREGEERG